MKAFSVLQQSAGDRQAAIAHRLALQYTILQEPAMHNIRYSHALKDFTGLAILAYECGYDECTVKEEMASSPLEGLNHDECLLYTCVVWITIALSPSRSVVRWATKGNAVTDGTMNLWKGFVSLILGAYFEKRMAWYPVDRLQMEVSAMTGRLERPSTIAEFARLVYSTLNTVAPQFPESCNME
ncbi:g8104 [Coccomyxa viridis]|uniref:G8104 protein n=1 Tax=Coccomyxa viridis TaxID=1274662 RepID=A0ABP1FZN4_9CHLO